MDLHLFAIQYVTYVGQHFENTKFYGFQDFSAHLKLF